MTELKLNRDEAQLVFGWCCMIEREFGYHKLNDEERHLMDKITDFLGEMKC